mmetsp:Transcript_26728/g.44832  ORF Transcript_26728/g.44832 Transcript_26728/m.44832 type:complete len:115 (+) Transcript_26728:172-516(+)|eukprot:CAMPEP_0198208308 /NCGR_PEP_ID=MMETSP1445-20131203/11689_1 /TAXON_ID=36898 /ORGANISM="Pyramimonas sp., Strain CCMP2087" /LENGTH=114 /DNA_ID=CAMNT_0043881659 /DNA_START=155 /DNA_END=499 /DNA_ORIENTATION=-
MARAITGKEVKGMYEIFNDGPCGKIYAQWETCVEDLRRENDVDSLETKCPLETPADLYAKCMVQHQQYAHLVTPGTKHELVTEGLTNIFAIMYGFCRTHGKCNEGTLISDDVSK